MKTATKSTFDSANKPSSARELSTAELIEQIAAGSRIAEDAFYRQFKPFVQSVLRRLTTDASLIEDMTQDALLTVLLNLRSEAVNEPAKINSYVAQTAKYTLIGWYRKKSNDQANHLPELELEAANSSLETHLLTQERRQFVKRIINNMKTPRDRALLQMSYVHDEDKPSVCRHFDLQSLHFDRVISRARGRFKKLVQSQPKATQEVLQMV